MPYITQQARVDLENNRRLPETVGELNYEFTLAFQLGCVLKFAAKVDQLINSYIATKGKSYKTFNDIMGAAQGASVEWARRTKKRPPFLHALTMIVSEMYRDKVTPYEIKKCQENGDVYPEELTRGVG